MAKLRIRIAAVQKVVRGCMREMGVLQRRMGDLEARVVDAITGIGTRKRPR